MQYLPLPTIRHLSRLLAIAPAAFSLYAAAETVVLDSIMVIGAGQGSVYDVAQPMVVLDKSAIGNNPGSTLGTLLDNTPGVANAAFGAGVGRPVIRGMGGNRVRILVNGSDSADVSAMSSDHGGSDIG